MHYTLHNNLIQIMHGTTVIAFIEPKYFHFYPYFDAVFGNEIF